MIVRPQRNFISDQRGRLVELSRHTANSMSERGSIQEVTLVDGKAAKIFQRGKGNDLPQRMEEVAKSNNLLPNLIDTQVKIWLGQGMAVYKEVLVEDTPKKVRQTFSKAAKDFFSANDINAINQAIAFQLAVHSRCYLGYVRDLGGKIKSVKVYSCRHIAAEQKDKNGVINNYYYCANWSKFDAQDQENTNQIQAKKIPVYNPEETQNEFMVEINLGGFTDGYYCIPKWWSAKKWIEMTNVIPDFHIAALQNMSYIPYHVQIPENYFLDYERWEEGDETKRKELETEALSKEQQFIDDFNKTLAGAENAGRLLTTSYPTLGDKALPGIIITPLPIDIKSNEYIDLFNASNTALLSAFGLMPSLAGMQTPGQMSSGSDIRNSLEVNRIVHAPMTRKCIVKWLDIPKKEMKWSDEEFDFEDTAITTLDQNSTGRTQVVK